MLVSPSGVKLIDLGAAADLVAGAGPGWDPEEAVFDPLYGPPERFLTFPASVAGAVAVALAWPFAQPGRFDAWGACWAASEPLPRRPPAPPRPARPPSPSLASRRALPAPFSPPPPKASALCCCRPACRRCARTAAS